MIAIVVLALFPMVALAGCATHADFLDMREQLSTVSRSQEQNHQRMDSVSRRMESIERVKDGDTDPGKQRIEDVVARLQKLEGRLTKLEGTAVQVSARAPEQVSPERHVPKLTKQTVSEESGVASPVSQGITPTAAFNLAYNDYLNGKYELAAAGFQRFVKDFSGTSLSPNAHYWMGESYYNLKDYGRAVQTFEFLVTEYPGNEKTPAALYKLGLATAETGDLAKSRKSLKRVLEEFPSSNESRLAKNKLAEIR